MTDAKSFFIKLKDNTIHTINNVVKKINAFNDKTEKKEEKEGKEEKDIKLTTSASIVEGADTNGPSPTDNSASDDPIYIRIPKKIGDQIVSIAKSSFLPFLAVMMAMFIANEMIVYAAPIRLIFFIFTLFVCLSSTTILSLIAFYYLGRAFYTYYINNMTDRPKVNLMPTIFSLIPLTTRVYKGGIARFFTYPFTYPKTEIEAKILPEKMQGYLTALNESFEYYQKIKGEKNPFEENDAKLKYFLDHMHDIIKDKDDILGPVSAAAVATVLSLKKEPNPVPPVIAPAVVPATAPVEFFPPQVVPAPIPTPIETPSTNGPTVEGLQALEKEKTQFLAPKPQ